MASTMKYVDYRDSIKSGDLLAWSHRGWKSWYDIKVQMVRFFTQSEYSHVGTAWVYGGRIFVIESVSPYIRIVPLSNLLPCYLIKIYAPWKYETEKFALSLVGIGGYSQWEAVKAFFRKNDNPDKWECAEFVHELWKKDSLSLTPYKDTPSEVVLEAQSIGTLIYLGK